MAVKWHLQVKESTEEGKSKVEGEEDVADKPAVLSHSEAFVCFSKCVRWLDWHRQIVTAQYLPSCFVDYSKKAANKRASTFKQQRITNFFS